MAAPRSASKNRWIVAGATLLLALVQVRLVILVQSTMLDKDIDAAMSITTGHAHWRVHQDRVLGPYILKGLSTILFGDTYTAYVVLMTACLWLAGYQAARLGRDPLARERDHGPWLSVTLFHLAFALLVSKTWLYIWDFIGLNVLFAFTHVVLRQRRWQWLVPLFVVAIFNRNSALLIPMWLVLDPISRHLVGQPFPKRQAITMLGVGAIAITLGQVVTEGLRNALLVEERGPALVGGVPDDYGKHFFWELPKNVKTVADVFRSSSFVSFVTSCLPVVAVAVALGSAVVAVRRDRRHLGFSIAIVVAVTWISLFALFDETRVFLELVPLVIGVACATSGAPVDPDQSD